MSENTISTKAVLTGRILSGIPVLFLTFDAIIHLLRVPAAVEGSRQLGYPVGMLVPLGIIELVALALYLIPRTAVLGAIIWTGYLGGAVATHVQHRDSLFGHILFPTYVAAMLWGGLWLRQLRLRQALPLHLQTANQ